MHKTGLRTISQRMKHLFVASVFAATQFAVPLGILTQKAHAAAGDITVGTFEGQNSDLSWSPGNNTQFAEGDYVNYRFPVTSSANNTSGVIYVKYSTCMFTNYFALYDSTAPATVTPGTQTSGGGDWSQKLTVAFPTSGTATIHFTLRISNTGGDCNGSSSHVALDTTQQDKGDFGNIGSKDIPIPASSIYYSPSLTITKIVNSGTALPSDFYFTVSPAVNGQTELHIPAGQSSVTVTDVNPDGSFVITEHGPAGYTFSSGTGTNCSVTSPGVMTATVTAGRPAINAACTFTNDIQKGSITITKDAVPNGPQDFSFTTTGAGLSNFSLDDDADPTLPNSKTFSDLLPGTYSITESDTAGWDFDNISCQGTGVQTSGKTVTITLGAGENVSCTYTNRQRAQLIVHKVTDPASDPTNFTVTASGTSSVPGATAISGNATRSDLSTSNDVVYDVAQGTYSVSEDLSNTPGWTQTGNTCFGLVVNGNTPKVNGVPTVECTIVNTKQGSITIAKNAVPDSSQDFNFTATGQGVSNFSLDDDADATLQNSKTFSNLLPGGYTFAETATMGWDFDNISCSQGANVVKNGATVTVNLQAGQNVTCTYTNKMHGQLIVRKATYPAGVAQLFDVTASSSDGGLLFGGNTGQVSDSQDAVFGIQQGKTYSVSEASTAGWAETSNTCVGLSVNGNSPLVNGVPTVYCDIVNTQQASLTIKKVTNPSGDQTLFDFLGSGQTAASFQLADGQSKKYELTPGQSQTVTELVGLATGWSLTGLSCTSDSTNSDVSVELISHSMNFTPLPGENVSCTFTNTKLGSLSGYKYEVNSDNSIVTPSDGWLITLLLNGQSTGQTYTTSAGGYYEFTGLLPGNYSVVETLQNGWTQMYSPTAVDLSAGQNSADNDFGNFQNASISGTKFNDLNGKNGWDNGEPGISGWKITLTGTTSQGPVSDSTNTDGSGEYSFDNLAPGDYTVCEDTTVPGWTQTYPTTNGGCYDISVTLSGHEYEDNDFGNQARGTLTVIKNVDDGFGGVTTDVSGWTWDFAGSYADDTNQVAGSSNAVVVPADTYTINENQQTNYHFTSVSCYKNNVELMVNQSESVDVSVGAGDAVVCTFVNTRDTANITVTKEVVNNNGGSAKVSDFDLYVNKDLVMSGATNPFLTDETYDVSEMMNVSGYDQTSLTCWLANDPLKLALQMPFTLQYGQDVDCKIVNDDIAPKLTVYKFVDNGITNNTKTSADFTMTVVGTNVSSPSFPGEETGTTVTLDAGDYTASEDSHDGYAMFTYGDCDGTIGVGEHAHCYIENVAVEDPQINVEKSGPAYAYVGNTVTYTFTVTNTGNVPLPGITVDDDVAGIGVYQSGDTNADDILDQDETWIYTATYTIPSGVTSVHNTVTACFDVDDYYQFGYDDELQYERSEAWRIVPEEFENCAEDDHTTQVFTPQVLGETTLENTGNSLSLAMMLSTGLLGLAVLTLLQGKRHRNFIGRIDPPYVIPTE